MPEFFGQVLGNSPPFSPVEVLIRLTIALVLGFVVAWIYRSTRAKEDITESFPTTLVLLSVLIAMVTEVIGESVARAFSLVGALSIVRFRTVVRDTQDTAFVIFAVVVGMAVGAADPRLAVIGLAVVGIGVFLTMPRSRVAETKGELTPEFLLSVRLTLGVDLEALTPALDRYVAKRQLRSFGTVRQGAAVEAIYGVRMKSDSSPVDLVSALNRIEGVQSVELERPQAVED
jgi:hypothetical protein